MSMSTIVIVGAGAMGGLWAGRLSAAGHVVTVVDPSPELRRAVDSRGLQVVDGDETLTQRVTTRGRMSEVGIAELVFVFVKGPDTGDVARGLPVVVGPTTTVVTLQNGWGNADVLASCVPPDQLVVGVTYEGASILAPGVVRRASRATTEVGPYRAEGGLARAAAVASVLDGAGLPCVVSDDVLTAIWRKLIHNAAVLPVAALCRLRGEQLVEAPVDVVVDQLVAEAAAVARAIGRPIETAASLDRMHAVMGTSGRSTPSMLADVEAGPRTEIDSINGAVLRAAAEAGVDAPLHQLMVSLVHGLERSWEQ